MGLEIFSSTLDFLALKLSREVLKDSILRGQLTAFSFFFLKLKKDLFFFFFPSRSLTDPVSEAEQLSSTSERWEVKLLETLRVLRAGSLELLGRDCTEPEMKPRD